MGIRVNRAPVLALWAAVVAERLGHGRDAARSLGRAVAALNAQAKGRRLGIFEAPGTRERGGRRAAAEDGVVSLLGREVPVRRTARGDRAVLADEVLQPAAAERYLRQKFGDRLEAVEAAMRALAGAYPRRELATAAYPLYERFRPEIPEGARGWGARGELDLDLIHDLAEERKPARRRSTT